MTRAHAGALLVLGDPVFSQHRTRLAELAATSRLPAIYRVREHVEAGGLMSYGPSLPDMRRRAAMYVDKILKGGKPADLPVEQPASRSGQRKCQAHSEIAALALAHIYRSVY